MIHSGHGELETGESLEHDCCEITHVAIIACNIAFKCTKHLVKKSIIVRKKAHCR